MKITRTGRNSRRITFQKPGEGLLFIARMNENNFCYEAAARLYREAGDEESAKRCEAALPSNSPSAGAEGGNKP